MLKCLIQFHSRLLGNHQEIETELNLVPTMSSGLNMYMCRFLILFLCSIHVESNSDSVNRGVWKAKYWMLIDLNPKKKKKEENLKFKI